MVWFWFQNCAVNSNKTYFTFKSPEQQYCFIFVSYIDIFEPHSGHLRLNFYKKIALSMVWPKKKYLTQVWTDKAIPCSVNQQYGWCVVRLANRPRAFQTTSSSRHEGATDQSVSQICQMSQKRQCHKSQLRVRFTVFSWNMTKSKYFNERINKKTQWFV